VWVFVIWVCVCVCVDFVICVSFGNMCTCINCVLSCSYCVFGFVSFMFTFSYFFCLYCHRVTTQLQLVIIIIILINYMNFSGQSHALAALSPVKAPRFAFSRKPVGPQSLEFSEKSSISCVYWDSTPTS
jgi:hypothetical protein